MQRRHLLKLTGGLPLMSTAYAQTAKPAFRRVRPSDPGWPSAAHWQELSARVGGRLVRVESPVQACAAAPTSTDCAAVFKGLKNPYYIPRSRGAYPDQRLGRCVGVGAECLGGRRQERRRCRRRRQFRPRARAAPGREGRRPQLPGHVERGRFAAGLDARDGRRSRCTTPSSAQAARRPRRSVRCRSAPARSGAMPTTRSTKAGRYVQGGGCHHGRRRGPGPERRLRQLLQALWPRVAASLLEAEVVTADGEVLHRQCLQQPRPVLGPEGRRRRQPRRGHPADLAHARRCRKWWSSLHRREGLVGRGLPAADRALRRLLPRQPVQSRTGANRSSSIPTTRWRSRWCSRAPTRRRLRRRGSRSSTGWRRRPPISPTSSRPRSSGCRPASSGIPSS